MNDRQEAEASMHNDCDLMERTLKGFTRLSRTLTVVSIGSDSVIKVWRYVRRGSLLLTR